MCKDVISFLGISNSSFPCGEQHKHIRRTQKGFFFLFTNAKLIIFSKNVIYPFMDNTVIRRLCNLLLQSYFLFSLDLCSFICKMKEGEDTVPGLCQDAGVSRRRNQPFSLSTPFCLPPQMTPPPIKVPLP